MDSNNSEMNEKNEGKFGNAKDITIYAIYEKFNHIIKKYKSVNDLWKKVEKAENGQKFNLIAVEEKFMKEIEKIWAYIGKAMTVNKDSLEEIQGQKSDFDKDGYNKLIDTIYMSDQKSAEKFKKSFPHWSYKLYDYLKKSAHYLRLTTDIKKESSDNLQRIFEERNSEFILKAKKGEEKALAKMSKWFKQLGKSFLRLFTGDASKTKLSINFANFFKRRNEPWRRWWELVADKETELKKNVPLKLLKNIMGLPSDKNVMKKLLLIQLINGNTSINFSYGDGDVGFKNASTDTLNICKEKGFVEFDYQNKDLKDQNDRNLMVRIFSSLDKSLGSKVKALLFNTTEITAFDKVNKQVEEVSKLLDSKSTDYVATYNKCLEILKCKSNCNEALDKINGVNKDTTKKFKILMHKSDIQNVINNYNNDANSIVYVINDCYDGNQKIDKIDKFFDENNKQTEDYKKFLENLRKNKDYGDMAETVEKAINLRANPDNAEELNKAKEEQEKNNAFKVNLQNALGSIANAKDFNDPAILHLRAQALMKIAEVAVSDKFNSPDNEGINFGEDFELSRKILKSWVQRIDKKLSEKIEKLVDSLQPSVFTSIVGKFNFLKTKFAGKNSIDLKAMADMKNAQKINLGIYYKELAKELGKDNPKEPGAIKKFFTKWWDKFFGKNKISEDITIKELFNNTASVSNNGEVINSLRNSLTNHNINLKQSIKTFTNNPDIMGEKKN